MTYNLVWEDPPERNTKKTGVWEPRLAPLVDHPKRWAMIWQHDDQMKAAQLVAKMKARRVRIPRSGDDWEFVSRGIKVYARYMGPTL